MCTMSYVYLDEVLYHEYILLSPSPSPILSGILMAPTVVLVDTCHFYDELVAESASGFLVDEGIALLVSPSPSPSPSPLQFTPLLPSSPSPAPSSIIQLMPSTSSN